MKKKKKSEFRTSDWVAFQGKLPIVEGVEPSKKEASQGKHRHSHQNLLPPPIPNPESDRGHENKAKKFTSRRNEP